MLEKGFKIIFVILIIIGVSFGLFQLFTHCTSKSKYLKSNYERPKYAISRYDIEWVYTIHKISNNQFDLKPEKLKELLPINSLVMVYEENSTIYKGQPMIKFQLLVNDKGYFSSGNDIYVESYRLRVFDDDEVEVLPGKYAVEPFEDEKGYKIYIFTDEPVSVPIKWFKSSIFSIEPVGNVPQFSSSGSQFSKLPVGVIMKPYGHNLILKGKRGTIVSMKFIK